MKAKTSFLYLDIFLNQESTLSPPKLHFPISQVGIQRVHEKQPGTTCKPHIVWQSSQSTVPAAEPACANSNNTRVEDLIQVVSTRVVHVKFTWPVPCPGIFARVLILHQFCYFHIS